MIQFPYLINGTKKFFKATELFLMWPAISFDFLLKKCGCKPYHQPVYMEFILPLQQFISDCSINALARYDKDLESNPLINVLRSNLKEAREFAQGSARSGENLLLFIDVFNNELVCAPYYKPIPSLQALLGSFQFHKNILMEHSVKIILNPDILCYEMQQLMLLAESIESVVLLEYGIGSKTQKKKNIGFRFNGIDLGMEVCFSEYYPEILNNCEKIRLWFRNYCGIRLPLMGISCRDDQEKEIQGKTTSDEKDQPGINPENDSYPSIQAESKQQDKTKKPLTPHEGLGDKIFDYSDYMLPAKLTDRQYEVYSLVKEYGLSIAEVARRFDVSRATITEHVDSAENKINNCRENYSKARSKRRN